MITTTPILQIGEWGRVTFGSYEGEIGQVEMIDLRDLFSHHLRLKGTDIVVGVLRYALERITPQEQKQGEQS